MTGHSYPIDSIRPPRRGRAVPHRGWRTANPRHWTAARLVLAALLLAVSQAPVQAQSTDPDLKERLERELRRTDEMIEETKELVRASESERARRLLLNAARIQATAWEQFHNCRTTNVRACRGASEATTRARRDLRHSVQVAREESSQERAAQITIDRAQRMLDEAQTAMPDETVDQRRTRHLLDQAQAQLERAREQFRERHFGVALQLAQGSMRLIQQALHIDDREQWRPERVRRELERTERLLERAAPLIRVSGNERAQQLLDRAVASQGRARNAFESRRLLIAVRMTREARDHLQRALRMVEGPVDAAAVRRALGQTDALIARVEPVVREAGHERATELLRKGLERQVRAKDLLGEERLRAALAQTRLARRLVNEALEMVQRLGELAL